MIECATYGAYLPEILPLLSQFWHWTNEHDTIQTTVSKLLIGISIDSKDAAKCEERKKERINKHGTIEQ